MMEELKSIKRNVSPTDILLVVDAMTGQEAANLVRSFNDEVGISGAILTKLDGDSRGGAALSIKEVSGKPIKFTGVGEKLEALEIFYPDRMANRILGMGDVLTLVEKAQDAIQAEEAAAIAQRMMENKFDFNDFLKQYKLVSNMGSMGSLLKMMPGMAQLSDKQIQEGERNFKMFEAMINSMTPAERANPELLAKRFVNHIHFSPFLALLLSNLCFLIRYIYRSRRIGPTSCHLLETISNHVTRPLPPSLGSAAVPPAARVSPRDPVGRISRSPTCWACSPPCAPACAT